MSLPTDAAQMARDGGINTPKLGNNAFTTDKLFQIGQGQFIGRDNTQTGTGNVNATQTYPDISLTSALSAPFNATTAWRSLSAYLNQVDNTNSSSTPVFLSYTTASFFGTAQGALVAPNGKIYTIPRDGGASGTRCFIVDPDTESVTFFGTFSSGYQNGVLAPNGKIYFIQDTTTLLPLVDPSNNSVQIIATINNSIFDQFDGAVAPNGKVYIHGGFGSDYTLGIIIDPSNNSIATLGTFSRSCPAGGYANAGVVLAPNGRIYCMPAQNSLGEIIDPETNSVVSRGYATFTGAPSTDLKYTGGVLAPNGKIYCIPYQSTICQVIDPSTNTLQSFGTFSGAVGSRHYGGVLAPNGLIYLMPYASTTIIRAIDPSNNTISVVCTIPTGYLGGVLCPNGKIFIIPNTASQGLFLNFNFNNKFNMNRILSPFYNKF